MVTLERRNSEELSPLREEGKLATFFRTWLVHRHGEKPSPAHRVFGRDLVEHLADTADLVPRVVTLCSALVEERGIVEGIYRLAGITSNVQALRRAFDDARFPDLLSSQLVMKDIHSVSSLLKMYFRELPDPVCTFSLYDRFVSAVQSTDEDDERSCELRKVLGCLPRPNHRTLASLVKHLHRVSLHSESTGMTARNLAIVWAPNLLRCRALEEGGPGLLAGVGVQASVTESLIKLCHNIFPEEEEEEEQEEKSEEEAEELGEEIDIAVFLHEVEAQTLPSEDPACSPVVLRRGPASANSTVQRLSSGGRGINFRDTIRRFASPVLLRRRHSDADSIGAELGTESPKEEIIRRSLRLRDRIVSALSPQRLSEGSFKGSLEPRALSFTSIPDSESAIEEQEEPFTGPAFGVPFIDASCEMLDSIGSQDELARRLIEGNEILVGDGVISIIGSSVAASSGERGLGSVDSLFEPGASLSSCDLSLPYNASLPQRPSLSPPPHSPPPTPLTFSSFTSEVIPRPVGLKLYEGPESPPASPDSEASSFRVKTNRSNLRSTGTPSSLREKNPTSLKRVTPNFVRDFTPRGKVEVSPNLRDTLTPERRTPMLKGEVTPSLESVRSSGLGRERGSRSPITEPAAHDPVLRNFPLFFENESKSKKKPKEKTSNKEKGPKEYKKMKDKKGVLRQRSPSNDSCASSNATWDSRASQRSPLPSLCESTPSSERGGTHIQSWRRGAVSPPSERGNGYVSPASMRGTPPLSPEKREVSPASERGTPKLWSRGATEASTSNSDPAESRGGRVGSPVSSERGFVSLLGRRGKQTLSPLTATRSPTSIPSSPLSPVGKSRDVHSPSGVIKGVTLSPGESGRQRTSGSRGEPLSPTTSESISPSGETLRGWSSPIREVRGRGPLLRGSTLSPVTTEPAVIEVEEEKGGVGYNLHHFTYSKAACGGER